MIDFQSIIQPYSLQLICSECLFKFLILKVPEDLALRLEAKDYFINKLPRMMTWCVLCKDGLLQRIHKRVQ